MLTNSDRPWMTALETQFDALSQTRRGLAQLNPSNPHHTQTGQFFAGMLSRAQAYSWSSECVTAVRVASRTVPPQISWSSLELPNNPAWWWLGHIDSDFANAIAFGKDGDGWLYAFGCVAVDGDTQVVPYTWFGWKPGTPLSAISGQTIASVNANGKVIAESTPGDEVDKSAREIGRFIAAGCAWLNQRVVTDGIGRVERHRRKQLAREYGAEVSDVKVIQLRRAESSSRGPFDSGEPVEWSCRWIVNGHWRNQYHPSTGKHELKYILPYVKGPDDKPLKVPKHTVYAVNR